MSTIAGRDVHPAADLFPLITGDSFEAFVADIKANGLMEPIVVDSVGQIIDGRNRARACERVGIAITTTTYEGSDVIQYVVSHNLHRRHLTDSQRAMIAAKLATRRPGYRNETARLSIDDPHDIGGIIPPSVPEVAQLLGVKANTVTTAKRIIRDGTADLQSLIAEGAAPVSTGARVAELPPAEQDAYVKKVRAGANPVKAAPPDLKQREARKRKTSLHPDAPPAPRSGGNKRKHLQQLDALVASLAGIAAAFDGVVDLDPSVTREEATRLTCDLSREIRSLNRINNLIKERTT